MPRHLGMRAVRVLCRWHIAWSGVPSFRPIALATAFVIVGGPVLETGAVSSTPEVASAPPAHTTAVSEARDVLVSIVLPPPGSPARPVVVLEDLGDPTLDGVMGSRAVVGATWTGSQAQAASVEYLAVVGDSSALSRGAAPSGASSDTQNRASALSAADKAAAKRNAKRKRLIKRRKDPGPWRVSQRVTWYGPGFYGNRTACGQRYTRTIRGVAHRSLPCGTMVQFRWKGKVRTAPVIDRGPYGHRDLKFDFSAAVACKAFRPRKGTRGCFTRYDVRYRVVGKVNLNRWFKVVGN